MKTFNEFIKEEVTYNKPDPKRQGEEEHNENVFQSHAIKSGDLKVHPAFAKAIDHFAKNKPAFKKALENSSVEKIRKGTKVNNTELGQNINSVEDKGKVKRVRGMVKKGQPIDRPIVLRHRDENGKVHHHLLAGNTRATAVGYGVEAHHIDV